MYSNTQGKNENTIKEMTSQEFANSIESQLDFLKTSKTEAIYLKEERVAIIPIDEYERLCKNMHYFNEQYPSQFETLLKKVSNIEEKVEMMLDVR